jgi:MFS superfamily sulfate permease-like transporter
MLNLVPAPLLVVVIGVVISEVCAVANPMLSISPEHRVSLPIASSWSELAGFFAWPDFTQIMNTEVYSVGFTLALIASLETLICVEATDKLDPQKRVTPTNRELKAQGVGNIACGLLGGIPVTQVIVRSAANLDAGGRTRLASFVHGVLLAVCVLLIPAWLNRIPLACLAAILLVTGYKLARISLFVSMCRAGVWQFVPFIATVAVLVLTDMLTGIFVGLAVGLFHILMYNYRLSYLKKDLGGGKYIICLSEHMTFLNKASVMNVLRELPNGCHVTIDATQSLVIDPDVREVLQNFAAHAPMDGITLDVKGLEGLATPG